MALRDSAAGPFCDLTTRWDSGTPSGQNELQDWQLARAWAIAENLSASNPFYRRKLGVLPKERSAETFRALPITTKQDVCEDCTTFPPFGSRTTCEPENIQHFVETSGTSGQGREVYALDASDEINIYRAEAVGFFWAGVRRGSRVLLTLPVGMTAAGLWYYGGLHLLGANVMSVGAYSTDRKVAVLKRFGADVIVGTPSYVQRLAAACESEGIDPASLGVKSLMVAGESYDIAWVRAIQARWGATLYEQYGCTQRAIAWTCPGGVLRDGTLGALHFVAELSYCEIIDPATKQPARPGQSGEVIVTTLQANASPLLRFATRDRVQVTGAEGCSCGRPLLGIRAGGVQRYDDMLKIKGINVWPASFDSAVFGVPGVINYQGLVKRDSSGSELVEIVAECRADHGTEVAHQIVDGVRRNIGLGVTVTIVNPGDISRAIPEGFVKMSRWRDLRNTAAAPHATRNT